MQESKIKIALKHRIVITPKAVIDLIITSKMIRGSVNTTFDLPNYYKNKNSQQTAIYHLYYANGLIANNFMKVIIEFKD